MVLKVYQEIFQQAANTVKIIKIKQTACAVAQLY